MSICYVDSPVGRLALEADHDAVTGVRWASRGERAGDGRPSPAGGRGLPTKHQLLALEGVVLERRE